MFTGIIQNTARVEKKKESGGQVHFMFRLKKSAKLTLGESIAVNGVCLTAAKIGKNYFEADVIDATLRATALGSLKVGSYVNLERSLRFGDLIGGHFVSGHVDCQGRILGIKKKGDNVEWALEAPKALRPYLAKKGSVAVDGVSLTIQDVTKASFSLGLVPHTLLETNFQYKKIGDWVNLEADLIARYCALAGSQEKAAAKISAALNHSEFNKKIKQMKLQGF